MLLNELYDPKQKMIDAALAAMHRRVSSKGDLQSIGGYAFDIVRSYNIGISAKELERLYREKYNVNEGYKLHLERDSDMYVLHIVDTATGKRTEVRGKSGYETDGYDSNDKLHQLLDRIGKTANVSELINGETVTINPKHPGATKAKAATDVAFNENFADGKVKGKSRPGRVKKSGASCKGSVTHLRKMAKKYSGERGKMYHWCANMKGGKK